MNLHQTVLLFVTALIAGVVNSVAGGGSFLSFPALVLTGVPPVQANATNTMALWPGTLASVGAYRAELQREGRGMLLPLIITGLIGGLLGAVILLRTPQAVFLRLIPYLLGSATLLFHVQRAHQPLGPQSQPAQSEPHAPGDVGRSIRAALHCHYIGFFGAGAGILMLAMFAVLGVESIHTMNAYKTVLATVCNGIAVITFILAGAILWRQAMVMLVAASLGGYFGAYFAQKMNPMHVRYTGNHQRRGYGDLLLCKTRILKSFYECAVHLRWFSCGDIDDAHEFVPQVLHSFRSKSVDGISWAMLICFTTGVALWLIYRSQQATCTEAGTSPTPSMVDWKVSFFTR